MSNPADDEQTTIDHYAQRQKERDRLVLAFLEHEIGPADSFGPRSSQIPEPGLTP